MRVFVNSSIFLLIFSTITPTHTTTYNPMQTLATIMFKDLARIKENLLMMVNHQLVKETPIMGMLCSIMHLQDSCYLQFTNANSLKHVKSSIFKIGFTLSIFLIILFYYSLRYRYFANSYNYNFVLKGRVKQRK